MVILFLLGQRHHLAYLERLIRLGGPRLPPLDAAPGVRVGVRVFRGGVCVVSGGPRLGDGWWSFDCCWCEGLYLQLLGPRGLNFDLLWRIVSLVWFHQSPIPDKLLHDLI